MQYDRTMTATTYLIDRENKQILLHIHKKTGRLYPLGGHIEPHELPHEAALREVFEESGLDVTLAYPRRRKKICSFELPAPLHLLHENVKDTVQNIDFIYAAFLPAGIKTDEFHPMDGESKQFFLVTKEELDAGYANTADGAKIQIPPHIRETAIGIYNEFFGDDT